mgnify:CR=1 FL=1
MSARPSFYQLAVDLFGEDVVGLPSKVRGHDTIMLMWPCGDHHPDTDPLCESGFCDLVSPIFYADNCERTDTQERGCPACGLVSGPTIDDPDACLGFIDSVGGACCGHGDVNEAHVAGTAIPGGEPHPQKPGDASLWLWGQDALDFFAKMGVGPPSATDGGH